MELRPYKPEDYLGGYMIGVYPEWNEAVLVRRSAGFAAGVRDSGSGRFVGLITNPEPCQGGKRAWPLVGCLRK